MAVRGEAITWPCCLAWIRWGAELYSSGGREEPESEALSCSAKEMNYWTVSLRSWWTVHPVRDISVCLCARLYAWPLHSPAFPVSLSPWHGLGMEELLLSHSPNYSCNHLTLKRVRVASKAEKSISGKTSVDSLSLFANWSLRNSRK